MKVAILRPRFAFKGVRVLLSEAGRSLSEPVFASQGALGRLAVQPSSHAAGGAGTSELAAALLKTLKKTKLSMFTLVIMIQARAAVNMAYTPSVGTKSALRTLRGSQILAASWLAQQFRLQSPHGR